MRGYRSENDIFQLTKQDGAKMQTSTERPQKTPAACAEKIHVAHDEMTKDVLISLTACDAVIVSPPFKVTPAAFPSFICI